MTLGHYHTTYEVAAELGITAQRVGVIARHRGIEPKRIGGQMFWTPKQIDAMRVRVTGRPRKDD